MPLETFQFKVYMYEQHVNRSYGWLYTVITAFQCFITIGECKVQYLAAKDGNIKGFI